MADDPTNQATAAFDVIQRLLKCLPGEALINEMRKHDWSRPGTITNPQALHIALTHFATELSQASGLPKESLEKLFASIKLPQPSANNQQPAKTLRPITAALPAALRGANGGPPVPGATATPNINDPKFFEQLRSTVKELETCGVTKLLDELASAVRSGDIGSWPERTLAGADLEPVLRILEQLSPILNAGWTTATSGGEAVDPARAVAAAQQLARKVRERIAAVR